MTPGKILQQFTPGTIFRKQEFWNSVHAAAPGTAETAINWMLHTLIEKGKIVSVGYGRYMIPADNNKPGKKYQYPHSDEFLQIENLITEFFPYAVFQMWELIQLNDFVNHQIAKNVIFVEVEKMLMDSVYELIHEHYPYAMYSPNEDSFYRQRAPETDIIVQKLLTEAPRPDSNHECTIEKILVDLFSKKLSGALIERSEYKAIFEDVFQKYHVDEIRMFRYARHRNLDQTIRDFIQDQTNIRLITEPSGAAE